MGRFVALIIVLAGCVALGVFAYERVPDESEVFSPTATEIWHVPAVEERRLSYPVEVRPVTEPSTPLRASAVDLQGLVTQVLVADDEPVVHGSALATVDLVPVIALHTPVPFHRSLRSGDRGSDVLMLNGMLEELGYLDHDAVDHRFGGRSSAAVAAFNEERLGLVNSRIFDAGRVVWLPEPTVDGGEVQLEVGRAWPEAGEPLIVPPDVVVAIDFDFEEQAPAEGGYQLVLTTRHYSAESVGQGRWRAVGPFSEGDLAVLAGAEDGEGVSAELVEAVPQRVAAVPLGALLVDRTGATCAFVRSPAGQDPIPVRVVRSLPGELWVAPDALDGVELLLNPAAAGREIDTC